MGLSGVWGHSGWFGTGPKVLWAFPSTDWSPGFLMIVITYNLSIHIYIYMYVYTHT